MKEEINKLAAIVGELSKSLSIIDRTITWKTSKNTEKLKHHQQPGPN